MCCVPLCVCIGTDLFCQCRSYGNPGMRIHKLLSFYIRLVFYICMIGNIVSKRRVFLINFLVKMFPCLPINGKRIHIVGSFSGGMLSERSALGSVCVVSLLISARAVNTLISFLVRLREKPFQDINFLMVLSSDWSS